MRGLLRGPFKIGADLKRIISHNIENIYGAIVVWNVV